MPLELPGLRSRQCRATVQFEASMTTVVGQERIERIRVPDGKGGSRWLQKMTWLRRVEALGLKMVMPTLQDVGEGEHTPEGGTD